MLDRWNLYQAQYVTDSILKINAFYRANASDDFEYAHDVTIIRLNDTGTDFRWLDEKKCAFVVQLQDSQVKKMKEKQPIPFILDANIQNDYTVYSYTNDKWNQYRAIVFNQDTLLIEKWGRFNAATQDFERYNFFMMIDLKNTLYDFQWIDENHSAFVIKLVDEDNSYWDEPKLVSFESDDSNTNNSASVSTAMSSNTSQKPSSSQSSSASTQSSSTGNASGNSKELDEALKIANSFENSLQDAFDYIDSFNP